MQYVPLDKINYESKDIPDGEIFTVYTKDEKWAFAIRINGEYSISKLQDAKEESPKRIKDAYAQVMYAKLNGWSNTGEKRVDEAGEYQRLFRCLYCRSETIDVEGPCNCRGYERPKAPSGFLLPGDW